MCGVDNGTITIYAVGGTPPLLYSIDGGATFTGSGNFTGLTSGNYYVVVTDSNNCGVFGDTVTMTAPGTPPLPSAGTNATYCDGDSMTDLTASASMGGTLTWYSDPGLDTVIGTGTTFSPDTTIGTTIYYVIETVGLCVSPSSFVTIIINPLPIVTLTASDDSICSGESITFTAEPAGCGNYDFYNNAILIQSGTDSIFTTNLLGDTNSLTVEVTCSGCQSTPGNPIVTIVIPFTSVDAGNDTSVCEGNVSFTLGGYSPLGGMWSGAGITDPDLGIFDSVLTGGDTVMLTYTFSNANCSVFKNKFIYVNALPNADAGNDLSVCPEERISLNATGGIKYLWNPDPTLSDINIFNPVANPEITTEYIVKVTDVNGCSNVDSVIVTLKDTCIENQLWLPNAFSPNNDKKNDEFYVRGINIEKIKFVIYNRWGEIVFENNDFPVNDPDVGWDGKHNGKEQNMAVFVYYVEAEFTDGTKGALNGDVTLIR
ncbi:MAG: gliding motility-associated C-terminal domain-containing protein [Cytophagales bacterium]|nr:gliding motility-associated C-terminal domain-containing protein [Cytophagales bacterium]